MFDKKGGFVLRGWVVLVGELDVVGFLYRLFLFKTASCMSEALAVARCKWRGCVATRHRGSPSPATAGWRLTPEVPDAMGTVGSGRVVMAYLLVGLGVVVWPASQILNAFHVQGNQVMVWLRSSKPLGMDYAPLPTKSSDKNNPFAPRLIWPSAGP